MPLSQRELGASAVPIVFQKEGEVSVRVGPGSVTGLLDYYVPGPYPMDWPEERE
jgi:hypothetical protein